MKTRVVRRLSIIAAGGFALALASAPAAANEASDLLVAEGFEALQSGQLLTATDLFIEALEADPTDGQAAFFIGVGMNRIGDHVQALSAIQQAQRLGYQSPEIDYEMGWALLGLGQHDLAIAALERYEESQPGRGKTSEFLGRAWLAKGDAERARTYFDEAVARDPGLAQSVEFQLAAIEYTGGDSEQATEYLNNVIESDPTSPLGQYLTAELQQLAAQSGADQGAEDKIWQVIATFTVGNDSNAIALGDLQPLPSGISNNGGQFIQTSLAGSVLAYQDPEIGQLVLNGSVTARRYGDNLSTIDSESWSVGANYTTQFRSDFILNVAPFMGGNFNDSNTTNRYVGFRTSVQFNSFDILWTPFFALT